MVEHELLYVIRMDLCLTSKVNISKSCLGNPNFSLFFSIFYESLEVGPSIANGISAENGQKSHKSVTCHGSIWVSTSPVTSCQRGAMVSFASHGPQA